MLKIGASRTEITPRAGIWQAGFSARDRPSEGVHIPLYTRAFVFSDGERCAAVSTNDLVGLSRPEIVKIRKAAAMQCDGLSESDIMISCTHTHSGPAVSSYLRGQPKDWDYIERLCLMIADTIADAYRNMRSGRLYCDATEVEGFNHNRRNEEDYCEKRLAWLEARNEEQEFMGGIVNFTAHPTMLTGYLLSGDYAGVLTQHMEQQLGAPVGMINGCHGNINAHPRAREDYVVVDDHGARLAEETLRLRDAPEDAEVEGVVVRSRMVEVTFGPAQPRSVYEEVAADEEQPDFVREWANDVMAKYPGDPVDGSEEGEVMVIQLGRAVIIGIPGHAFAEIGRDIMAALPDKCVFIANHANDYLGYFGTQQAHEEGGYEVEFAYRFNSSFRWAMDADTTYRIQNAAIELANG